MYSGLVRGSQATLPPRYPPMLRDRGTQSYCGLKELHKAVRWFVILALQRSSYPGNRGMQVLRRTSEDKTEFLLLSLWESYEAIRAFAGEDLERAVYYARDEEFLLEMEPKVTHYEYESYHEREVAMD